MKRFCLSVFIISILLFPVSGNCCTSAIFSGKVTESGRPVIWKNRDTGHLWNRVDYIPAGFAGRFGFYALVNCDTTAPEAWSGLNEAGFSIMNTVSYNIRRKGDTTPASRMDREGVVMYRALASCRTLADFEKLLDATPKPMGIEANFGVIDAEGGAAYYEVNNYTWVKYDVNDPEVAPDGYIIRSNYSFSGEEDAGQGYIRYDNAAYLIKNMLAGGKKISVRSVFDGLSRSYYHSLINCNFMFSGFEWALDQDFIPRASTSAVTVVEGVNPGEDPAGAVMWCAAGYPPVAVAMPVRNSSRGAVPQPLQRISAKNPHCAAAEEAMQLKEEVFSMKRGNGKKYINLSRIREIMSEIRVKEDKIFAGYEESEVR